MVIKYQLKIKPPSQMKLDFKTVRFDGATYNPEHDQKRLTGQILRVFDVMKDGNWHTYNEIHEITRDPIQSIATRLRDFRKFRFGEHTLLRRNRGHVKKGLNEYKLVVNHDWIFHKLMEEEI